MSHARRTHVDSCLIAFLIAAMRLPFQKPARVMCDMTHSYVYMTHSYVYMTHSYVYITHSYTYMTPSYVYTTHSYVYTTHSCT